LKAKLEQGN
jgi:hypothetical protein